MKLYIKNMVCNRCKMVVKNELEQLNLSVLSVELGEVEIKEPDIDAIKETLIDRLQRLGFELLDDKKSQIVERMKTIMVELVHTQQSDLKVNLSTYLSETLSKDYHSLSGLFSEVQGTTIEKYFIHQKIERVKELLTYDELNLSQIADLMHYSSVAHLSNQFKKITGFSPSYFK